MTPAEPPRPGHQRTPRHGNPGEHLFAVVLAAGAASRFGVAKQLELCGGTPLVKHAVRLAEGACGSRSLLVAGHEWRAVVAACRPLRGFFVNFTGYRGGMGESLACGVSAVDGAANAALILLADQPLVTLEHLQALIECHRKAPDDVIATAYAGTRGPPVIFPARLFGKIGRLQGDSGARQVLAEEGGRVRAVRFEKAAVDIDRPEDLDALS